MQARFEKLVEEHHRLVMTLIYRYYGGRLGSQAEDLSQEIWTKLWVNLKKNESNIVNFKSYLYRTVQTTLWDAIRRVDPHSELDPETVAVPAGQNERRWAAKLDVERLSRGLKREEHLMLKAHLRGFNYGEIATMLDCSEGRVRNLLTRIKKKLALAGG